MQEIVKFDVKISVIPSGLEKYIAFTINNNLIFIYSLQFMNSSLDASVKILSGNDFKHLSQEFSDNLVELVRQKGCKFTSRCKFFISLSNNHLIG